MKDTPLIAKSFEFSVGIINLCKVLHYRNEYTLSQQLMHAGTSVGAKLRESSNAQSKAESIRKLYEAQKECAETGYWLDLLIETHKHRARRVFCQRILKSLFSRIN